MIGQFFILSPSGDTIINKDFRGDAMPNMQELFFHKVIYSEPLSISRKLTFDYVG